MPILAFSFATIALGATAFFAAATLQLRGTSFLIGAYLIGWACVVGLAELLSLLDMVGRAGYVAGSAVLLITSAFVWHLHGRPLPRLPRLPFAALREHPQLVALGAVVLAAIGYEAFLVVATPPNNGDSLTYHLPRVVAWLQQGHAGYFDAPTQRATAFPGNAELGILWTVALLGRDTLVALPQLLAELGLLACVYGCGRRLSFSRPGAVFAALLTATLGQVALQSVTPQNDLVTASLVAAAVYFVLGRDRRELPLAGLAVGLVLGTKLTGLLALPLVAVIVLVVLPRRHAAAFAAWAGVAFACFGAFWYVENSIRTHHPLGVVPEAAEYRPHRTVGGTVSTAARISWRFIDFTGVNPPGGLRLGLTRTGADLFAAAHIEPNPPEATATARAFDFAPSARASEDSSYFGPLGFLLLLPVSAGFLGAWLCRRTTAARGSVAAALPLFILAVALTQSYNHWLGRFMLVPVAVTMALTGWLYDKHLRVLSLLVAMVGAISLVGTHMHNVAKPVGLLGGKPVWTMPRAEAETLNVGSSEGYLPQFLNATVPADARLGVVLGTNDPSYLLYGPTLRRRLVELSPPTAIREATAQGIRWIAASPDGGAVTPAPGWRVHVARGGWELLTKLNTPPARLPTVPNPGSAYAAAADVAAAATTGR